MRIVKAKALCDAFPIIYRVNSLQRGGRKYQLLFYFECAGGWFDLIWEFSGHLEKIANLINPEIKQPLVVQVKEKFGGLRVYIHHLPEAYQAVRELKYEIESRSFSVCEYCSKPGKRRATGWVKTLCDECNSKWDENDRFKRLHDEFDSNDLI